MYPSLITVDADMLIGGLEDPALDKAGYREDNRLWEVHGVSGGFSPLRRSG